MASGGNPSNPNPVVAVLVPTYNNCVTLDAVLRDAAAHGLPVVVIDDASTSVHFEYLDGSGRRHQIWFDNPTTLAAKYAWVAKAGLRGVGIFETTMLDRCSNASRAAMWGALSHFKTDYEWK